jgi:hypothetical protein
MQLIVSNNKYYQLKRIIKKNHFVDLKEVNEFKEFLHCNHVLQDSETYMFCDTVDDVEFEMIENTETAI